MSILRLREGAGARSVSAGEPALSGREVQFDLSRRKQRKTHGVGHYARLVCASMEGIVLRVRLISGDSMDVIYEDRDADSEDEVIDHIVSTLADDSAVLRCSHGDRLLVLYARGVAAVEVRPRGAVL